MLQVVPKTVIIYAHLSNGYKYIQFDSNCFKMSGSEKVKYTHVVEFGAVQVVAPQKSRESRRA